MGHVPPVFAAAAAAVPFGIIEGTGFSSMPLVVPDPTGIASGTTPLVPCCATLSPWTGVDD